MEGSNNLNIAEAVDNVEEACESDFIMSDALDGEFESYEPKRGMLFASEDDVKEFYRKYAYQKGFGIVNRTSKKGDDGKVNYIMLACSRQGKHVSTIPNTLKTLPTRRTNCEAKITVKKMGDGRWFIKTAILEHSHELSPTKARMLRVNKNLSMHVKRTIQVNDDVGVRIHKTVRSLAYEVGGYENLSFNEQDARNYVNKERRAIGKEGDGKALKNYFTRMQEKNSSFFYDIDVDDDFHVQNVFWVDARSRATYESFGDVVTFDTTYLTNKYDMPFAAFVGVNHHGQSVLLGCGLISTEDTESFVWLFKSWLRCMSGKAPDGIVTDQCRAMQNAIEIVFPTTRHRWCLWHIMKKIPEKLKGCIEYNNIKNAIKVAVYDTLTVEDFEEKWSAFIKEFELEDNNWLSGLYMERHRWVPIFLKKYFWAGMSTTQRSESMHAFFDGYINSKTSLQQFVKQYDNALRSKAEKEFEADFKSMDSTIQCGSNSPIERQFQFEYTHAKFVEVQAEFRGRMDCFASIKCVEGMVCTYHVRADMVVGGIAKNAIFEVVFYCDNHDVSCNCLLFEFRGIMCRHSLCVLGNEMVQEVSSKYILRRWSKNIRWRHAYIKSSYDVTLLKPQMQRFDKLCKHFYEVAEVAAEFEDLTEDLHRGLCEYKIKMQLMAASKQAIRTTCNGDDRQRKLTAGIETANTGIRSPLHVPRKGRPPSNRKMSKVDRVFSNLRKRKHQRRQTLTIDECNVGSSSQMDGKKLRIESSIEVNSCGECRDECTVVCLYTKTICHV